MFCTTQPWLKLSERRAHCTKKIRLLTDLWISTKKTSNTQVSTVSYPCMRCPLSLRVSRRERTNMSIVQDPGFTLNSIVNGTTKLVHVVHDKMELLCHA